MSKAIRIAVYCALIIGGIIGLSSEIGHFVSVGVVLAFIEILIDFTVEFNKDKLKDNMKKILDLILFVSMIVGALIISYRSTFGYNDLFDWLTRITLAVLIIVTIILVVINFIIAFKSNKDSE